MWRAERRRRSWGTPSVCGRPHARHIQRLCLRQRGKQAGQPAGEHRLPAPRRARQQQMVTARCGEHQRQRVELHREHLLRRLSHRRVQHGTDPRPRRRRESLQRRELPRPQRPLLRQPDRAGAESAQRLVGHHRLGDDRPARVRPGRQHQLADRGRLRLPRRSGGLAVPRRPLPRPRCLRRDHRLDTDRQALPRHLRARRLSDRTARRESRRGGALRRRAGASPAGRGRAGGQRHRHLAGDPGLRPDGAAGPGLGWPRGAGHG